MPTRKVGGGGIGAAVAALVIAVLGQTGYTVEPEQASLITGLAYFVTGWFLKETPRP